MKQYILPAIILLSMQSVYAKSTKEILADAPSFQLLLDNSLSSPALQQEFVNNAWPYIAGKLKEMPMGTKVIVNTVGNSALAPKSINTRIQKTTNNEGMSLSDVMLNLKNIVLTYPSQIKNNIQDETHIMGGLFDASKNINKLSSSQNVVVILSDMIEANENINCSSTKKCNLPKPEFTLDNTDIIALGVGYNLKSDAEMNLFKSWDEYLKTTKATVTLKKTF